MLLYNSNFIFLVNSKDVRLPQQMQRAMAAEAEASREARAKVSVIFLVSIALNAVFLHVQLSSINYNYLTHY